MTKATDLCLQLDTLVRNYITENNLPIRTNKEDFPLRKDFFYLDYAHADYLMVLEPYNDDFIGVSILGNAKFECGFSDPPNFALFGKKTPQLCCDWVKHLKFPLFSE